MLRHVTKDLYQIGDSVAGINGWHEAVRVYVLVNAGCPLVFDAGSHLHNGPIMTALKKLVGPTGPAYVFLTHTELPHTGNIKAILDTWPACRLVVSSGILPHVELPWWVREDQVQFAQAGTVETFGGRPIAFMDGILKDQPGTQWMYDARTQTLFTADALGYLFPATADALFDDEIDNGVQQEWLKRYHESAFRFLPMVNGARVNADMARVFAKRPLQVIAPTHGNAIRGEVQRCITRFHQAISEICR